MTKSEYVERLREEAKHRMYARAGMSDRNQKHAARVRAETLSKIADELDAMDVVWVPQWTIKHLVPTARAPQSVDAMLKAAEEQT